MIRARLGGQSGAKPLAGAGIWTLFELLAERVAKTSQGLWLKDLPQSAVLDNLSVG
jgi:hypothetical protein